MTKFFTSEEDKRIFLLRIFFIFVSVICINLLVNKITVKEKYHIQGISVESTNLDVYLNVAYLANKEVLNARFPASQIDNYVIKDVDNKRYYLGNPITKLGFLDLPLIVLLTILNIFHMFKIVFKIQSFFLKGKFYVL